MPKGKVVVKWGVDDGYVNRRPDFTLELDEEDFEGMTDTERSNAIDEAVRDEFFNRCALYWKVDTAAHTSDDPHAG